MKIGIVGMGFVGGATMEVLKEKHVILPYDKYKTKYSDPQILKEAEMIFICVPTPAEISGKIDISIVEEALGSISKLNKNNNKKPIIVIRSTVVPGTIDELEEKYPFDLISNPEFLRERHALEDMRNTDRIVIGANKKEIGEKLVKVYKLIFPNANYINVDSKTAEMIKYSSNVILAGQITLANEIFQICKTFNIDYRKIKDTLLLDERVARNIDVPGPDNDLGFGGKCFPKDLRALIYASRKKGYTPDLFEEVWRLNKRVRRNKDWLKIPGATSENNNFKTD